MIELTPEQRQELEGAEPARARDPQTGQTYVLVRADVYEKMRAILDGMTRRAGWDDPKLDDYEIYRKKKP
jgi:hypothetical protein